MPRTTAAASATAPRYAIEVPATGPPEIAGSGDACKSIFAPSKELGRGEQGVVFDIPAAYTNREGATWSVVMKISEFKGTPAKKAETKAKWIEEVRISKALGDMETDEGLRVAPKIISAWICGGKGYIIMERMKGDLRKVKGDGVHTVGEKMLPGTTDEWQKNHIDNAPFEIQDDYVLLLEHMIENGYVHMDNHPGNLGVLEYEDGDHGVLFDFGFTLHIADMNLTDKLYALAFSIGQILEHVPVDELLDSYLFMVFVNIMLQDMGIAGFEERKYEWGTRSPMINDEDMKFFIKNHKLKSPKIDKLPITAPSGMDHPEFYVGAKLYCYLLLLEQPGRYDWVNYNKIYDIRQNLALSVGENYTVAAAAAPAAKVAAAKKKVLRGRTARVAVKEVEANTKVVRRVTRSAAAAVAEKTPEEVAAEVTALEAKATGKRAVVAAKMAAAAAADAAAAVANAAKPLAARRSARLKKKGGRRACGLTRRRR